MWKEKIKNLIFAQKRFFGISLLYKRTKTGFRTSTVTKKGAKKDEEEGKND